MNNIIASFLIITIKMGILESIESVDIGDHLLPTTSPTNLRPSRKVRDNKMAASSSVDRPSVRLACCLCSFGVCQWVVE